MNDIKTIISDSPHLLVNNDSFFLSARLNSKVRGFDTNHSSNMSQSAPLDIVDSLQELLGKTR